MYRLLIVDDESHVVNWLYEMFKSETQLDLEVYKAYNGKDAVTWLERTYIDIVLTDIHMPEMDGMTLLKEIKDRWPSCRIIFLTGYDNFEYIYEAVKYDGIKYLLKSEDDELILNAVSEAIEEIEKSNRSFASLEKAENDRKKILPLLQWEFLSNIIDGSIRPEEISESVFESMEIPLLPEYPVLLLVTYLDFNSNNRALLKKSDILFTMKSVMSNFIGHAVSFAAVVHNRSYIVWFFQPAGNLKNFPDSNIPDTIWNVTISRIKGILDRLQASFNDTMDMKASFAVSETPCSWDAVQLKYPILRRLLNMYPAGNSGVIVTDDNQPYKDKIRIAYKNTELAPGPILSNKIQVLSSYLELGQKDGFFSLLSQICAPVKEANSMNYLPVIEIYFSVAVLMISYINTYQLWEKIAFMCPLYKLSRFDEHGSCKQAVEFLATVAEILFEIQENEKELRIEDTVSKIKKHIHENISSELSLYSLGETMHFNPAYLSRIFKKSVGVNLSEYIICQRIEKAKNLLECNGNKINEISKMIGCTSSNYFSRLFKKVVGMTPQQYRDMLQAGN